MKSLSYVRLFVTPWTVAYQAPPSMEFSRQEYWSGLPFPSPGNLPDPGIEPGSPALQADALPSEPQGKLQDSNKMSLADHGAREVVDKGFFFFFFFNSPESCLHHAGSSVFSCGIRTLSCSMWDLDSRSRLWVEPGPLALGLLSLSHWTTREGI